MADTLTEAMTQLENNIQQLESDTKWACGEIERLRHDCAELLYENAKIRALNTELSLKNENLLYWIRANIQADCLEGQPR